METLIEKTMFGELFYEDSQQTVIVQYVAPENPMLLNQFSQDFKVTNVYSLDNITEISKKIWEDRQQIAVWCNKAYDMMISGF